MGFPPAALRLLGRVLTLNARGLLGSSVFVCLRPPWLRVFAPWQTLLAEVGGLYPLLRAGCVLAPRVICSRAGASALAASLFHQKRCDPLNCILTRKVSRIVLPTLVGWVGVLATVVGLNKSAAVVVVTSVDTHAVGGGSSWVSRLPLCGFWVAS